MHPFSLMAVGWNQVRSSTQLRISCTKLNRGFVRIAFVAVSGHPIESLLSRRISLIALWIIMCCRPGHKPRYGDKYRTVEKCQEACLTLVKNCDAVNYDVLVCRPCLSPRPPTASHNVYPEVCRVYTRRREEHYGKCDFEQCNEKFTFAGTKGANSYIYVPSGSF